MTKISVAGYPPEGWTRDPPHVEIRQLTRPNVTTSGTPGKWRG
jgi:hypothetical protein